MNTIDNPNFGMLKHWLVGILVAFFVVLGSGCVSPRIDWDSRVGSYTYDEAVLEMGPPDKEAVLEDGRRVCEWLTTKGGSVATTPYGGYPYMGSYVVSESPDLFTRLIFTPEKRLESWKKVRK